MIKITKVIFSLLLINQTTIAQDLSNFVDNNQQGNINYVFGPSPKSSDSLGIFDANRSAMWSNLQDKASSVVLTATHLLGESILLASTSTSSEVCLKIARDPHSSLTYCAEPKVRIDRHPTRPTGTFLENTHRTNLKNYLITNNLELQIEGGHGLSSARCDLGYDADGDQDLSKAKDLGVAAANNEFYHSIRPLQLAGISVHKFYPDGAFLRLVNGSRKEHSCQVINSKGYSEWFAGKAVYHYMRRMKDLINFNNNDVSVEMGLLVNLINWRYNGYMEQLWQTDGVPNHQSADLAVALNSFKYHIIKGDTLYIKDIVIDYPATYIKHSTQRKSLNATTQPTCNDGGATVKNCHTIGTTNITDFCDNINCEVTTARTAFIEKVKAIWHQMHINWVTDFNQPKISFIVNSTESMTNLYAHDTNGLSCNGSPYLIPYILDATCSSNTTTNITNSNSAQEFLDTQYFNNSKEYANLITYGLPTHIDVDQVIFQSWHGNPRLNSSYASKIVNYINAR